MHKYLKLARLLVFCMTVLFSWYTFSISPAAAFTSLNACVQNNICASNLGQLAATQAATAGSGTSSAMSIQTTVGLGLTASTLSFLGLRAWEEAAKDLAREDEVPFETPVDCINGYTSIQWDNSSGGTTSTVPEGAKFGSLLETFWEGANQWIRYGKTDGTTGRTLSGGANGYPNLRWWCSGTEVYDTDYDLLEPYFKPALDELDLSPFVDVSPLAEPVEAPVIDAETGDIYQPDDFPLSDPEADPNQDPDPSPDPEPGSECPEGFSLKPFTYNASGQVIDYTCQADDPGNDDGDNDDGQADPNPQISAPTLQGDENTLLWSLFGFVFDAGALYGVIGTMALIACGAWVINVYVQL